MKVKDHKHTNVGFKTSLKGWKSVICVNFCQFPCSWIRIRSLNTDPDPQHCLILWPILISDYN
jgi:hypothetical protein